MADPLVMTSRDGTLGTSNRVVSVCWMLETVLPQLFVTKMTRFSGSLISVLIVLDAPERGKR